MQRNVILFNGATLKVENMMNLIKLKLRQWLHDMFFDNYAKFRKIDMQKIDYYAR